MNILLSESPERRVAIVSKSYALIFKAVRDQVNNKENAKPYCAIELIPKTALQNQGFNRLTSSEIYGFLGLMEVDGLIFLAAITGKSKVAAPTPGETVNKIFAVDFFCLNDPTWDYFEIDSSGYPILPDSDSSDLQNSLPKHPCVEIRRLLSNGSFYYSSDFDLTSTLQNRGYGTHSLSVDNYEEEYMWNSFLMQEIITYRDRLDKNTKQILDDEGFLTTVIRGFAETFITYVKKNKIALTVISKQSWKRAGTRFNARGVDDDGNVANFVETELLMYSNQYCFSFTEIRGSIPVFWEQDTSLINPKVQITRSIDATQPIFDDHFLRTIKKYGPVHVVNLLSTKSSEIELSQRYKEHITRSKKFRLNDDVFYTWFDFHRETAQEGFSGVKKVVPFIMDSLLTSGYFAYDVKARKVISKQRGVFRTNCLDCLDRTNLVQQTISFSAFKTFLEDFKFIPQKAYIEEDDFVTKHNTLWADHGDQISQIYTGTNALKSSYSRKGKMSLAGALSDATKSVSRMYINNFMDKGKQQNIDALLGRLPHQLPVQLYDPMNEYITGEAEKQANLYTSSSNVNIFIGTFNCNGTTQKTDLSKWLFPIGNRFQPDIFVIGLQEVIELTAGSILNADYTKGSFWENMVSSCLSKYDGKYLLLRVEQMSSLAILFFVRADKIKLVKQVEGATKKTGFGGMAGNKGAVAIRFQYDATSFCFVNCHLSAGVNNVEDRRNDYNSIMRDISFTRSKTISHHDSIFWLGDTNYRIALPNENVRRELASQEEGYIERLLQFDQLTQEINNGVVFKGFKEPTLKFRPTYKYDNGSERYDSSEKARTPSWTDRIIYKGDNLHPLAYSDASMLLSDHKPVYAAYRARVVHIDEAKRVELMKELYEKYKSNHPEEVSNLSAELINFGLDDDEEMNGKGPLPSDVSLLDINQAQNIPGPSTSSSSSSLSTTTSLSTSLLQPKKVNSPSSPVSYGTNTSRTNINSTNACTNRATSSLPTSTKPLLRPPPPPAHRDISSSESRVDILVNNVVSAQDKPSSSPSVSPSVNRSLTPPPIKSVSPPPGFSQSVLTPKNSTKPSPILSNNTTVSKTDIDLKQKSGANAVATNNDDEEENRVPLGNTTNKTLSSWQPLTPK